MGIAPGAALVSSSAVGDVVYQAYGDRVRIAPNDAAAMTSWAVDKGVWDGLGSEIVQLCLIKDGAGYGAFAEGLKSAKPEDVPPGSVVVDSVQ